MLSKDPSKRAVFYMVICAVLWSTSGLLIKLLPWNAMVIGGTRSILSALVYYIYMRRYRIPFVVNRHSILCGIFLSGTYLFFIAANKLTTSANAIVLQYTAPIFILILSSLLFKQKFRRGDYLTVAVTTLGIALFFFDELSSGYLLGNCLAIVAGLFFASMFISTGRADENSKSSGILLGHLITALIGLPFIFLFPTPVTFETTAAILALGIFQLGIPSILYGIAIRHCSPLACSLISAAEPLLNPVWVFLYNGEAPGFYALLGGLIVIVSIVSWSIYGSRASAAVPAEARDPNVYR